MLRMVGLEIAMPVDFDTWLTRDPGDAEVCEEHGRQIPCPICRLEYAEAMEEARRKERT